MIVVVLVLVLCYAVCCEATPMVLAALCWLVLVVVLVVVPWHVGLGLVAKSTSQAPYSMPLAVGTSQAPYSMPLATLTIDSRSSRYLASGTCLRSHHRLKPLMVFGLRNVP